MHVHFSHNTLVKLFEFEESCVSIDTGTMPIASSQHQQQQQLAHFENHFFTSRNKLLGFNAMAETEVCWNCLVDSSAT